MRHPLPYSPDLAHQLRLAANPADRALWLRLADGKQEVFMAWPHRVISIDNHIDKIQSSFDLLRGIRAEPPFTANGSAEPATPAPLPAPSDLPFRGGWAGVFGYDLATPHPCPESALFPALLLGDYRCFVHIDHSREIAELVNLTGHSGTPDDWANLLARATLGVPPPLACFQLTRPFAALTSKKRYLEDIGRIQRYLQAGDCYQVNYAQAFRAECKGSGATAMQRLLTLSQPSHAAWLAWPEGEVLCLSPELFLSVRQGEVTTRPIKGTAPRSANTEHDDSLRTELAQSPKNRAENLMIVDLLRNDLGRHAETGTVRVEKLFAIESLPQVHHMVSTVKARLRADSHVIDLIRDCFPGGSITGAPKRRAMEIIAELEPTPRAVYCGAIGYVNHDGDAELNIAIRTLLRVGDALYAWAGGGIVADSDPEAEYEECFHKMGALMRALEDGDA